MDLHCFQIQLFSCLLLERLILNTISLQVTCYFPDHGDTDWQIPEQLVPLDPEVNKLLPYQAIEVSLYGLEEVATNVTALSKLCDLALANTCVAEVVYR